MTIEKQIRERHEEIIVNLISADKYINLSFYGFILAKCRIQVNKNFPTLGVSFSDDVYTLTIGPKILEWNLNECIGTYIHETRHILGLHVFRKGERDHELFNVATDISINPLIDNLPKEGLFPIDYKLPDNKSAETYYELLKKKQEEQEKEKQEAADNGEPWDGPSDGTPDLTGLDQDPQTLDVHTACDGDLEELAKSTAENMVKEAMSQTKGDLPGDMDKILDLLKRKPVISWKKELRRILSSRNGSKVETIKRKNRRFPHRADLRGRKVHKDKPIVIVGVDTSGSMDDNDVLKGLVEINEVIKNVGELKIIQIDTNIKDVEDFNRSTFKRFHRHGYGGTYMGACPKHIQDKRLKCDVLIMISDMMIEDIPSDKNWKEFKKPVLWLTTSGIKPEVLKHHKIIDINKA